MSDCLVRDIDTSGLLEVIFWSSSSARPVPPRTKEQIQEQIDGLRTLLLTACLLESPPCWETQQTFSIDVPSWGWITCATSPGSRYCLMLPVVTLTPAKNKTSETTARKDEEGNSVIAAPLAWLDLPGWHLTEFEGY